MPRLPQPGGDDGHWGDILNDYLLSSHNEDGSLKQSAVASAGGGLVDSVQAGANVVIDNSDPANPVISAIGSGVSAVDSVNGKSGTVTLNHTDVGAASAAQGALADTSVQPSTLNSHTSLTTSAHGGIVSNSDPRLSDARAPTSHAHAGTDITSGTVPTARLNVGTGSGQVAAGNHTHTGFASSAQGALADSAVQPTDLADVATSGDYNDLINKPAIGSSGVQSVAGLSPNVSGDITRSSLLSEMGGSASDDFALGNHHHNAAYSALGHTHSISNVGGLQTALDGKAQESDVATVYVWNGSSYDLTGGRIFIGPTDPAVDGFTLEDGDQWEDTSE